MQRISSNNTLSSFPQKIWSERSSPLEQILVFFSHVRKAHISRQ